ncbi:hypothetical protein MATL_G00113850 [Megalops atlanticus]|uniref:Transcription cofactor vestigial-like protein 4 n=1 Tax=Megalops atlanticus TaxID=7932 RepID=A0A9D3Q4R7_MEGAT|nr:hypothetical protein MATL_G00113850 [Megalops atlanticus]
MNRLISAQLGQNGERSGDPRDPGHGPIVGLYGNHIYAPLSGSAMDQPLALTKHSVDSAHSVARNVAMAPGASAVERQQNRPSVITCAPAGHRTCNLSLCTATHNGSPPSDTSASTNTVCDPVIEEHFRRSLGRSYREPDPAPNSVSITGSVDDHFAKALGDTWQQIKAKAGAPGSAESAS